MPGNHPIRTWKNLYQIQDLKRCYDHWSYFFVFQYSTVFNVMLHVPGKRRSDRSPMSSGPCYPGKKFDYTLVASGEKTTGMFFNFAWFYPSKDAVEQHPLHQELGISDSSKNILAMDKQSEKWWENFDMRFFPFSFCTLKKRYTKNIKQQVPGWFWAIKSVLLPMMSFWGLLYYEVTYRIHTSKFTAGSDV